MAINQFQAPQRSPFERILGAVQGVQSIQSNIGELQKNAMERRLAEDQSDPNSDASKFAREAYSKITGGPIVETVSAKNLENTYGPISRFLLEQDRLQNAKDLEGMKIKAQEVKSNKPRELPPDKVLLVNEGNNIPGLLEDLRGTIGENKDLFGPAKGRFNALNPYDTTSQSVDAKMRASSQAFGRYMEGGVLRKEDEDKYRKMFPNLSDNPDVARNKLEIVQDLLVNKQKSNLKALQDQGFDISGLDVVMNKIPDKAAPKKKTSLLGEDKDAFDFANQNPTDPRSISILKKLKSEGKL